MYTENSIGMYINVCFFANEAPHLAVTACHRRVKQLSHALASTAASCQRTRATNEQTRQRGEVAASPFLHCCCGRMSRTKIDLFRLSYTLQLPLQLARTTAPSQLLCSLFLSWGSAAALAHPGARNHMLSTVSGPFLMSLPRHTLLAEHTAITSPFNMEETGFHATGTMVHLLDAFTPLTPMTTAKRMWLVQVRASRVACADHPHLCFHN